MSPSFGPDLWGVFKTPNALRTKAGHPRFAAWRERFFEQVDAALASGAQEPGASACESLRERAGLAQDAAFAYRISLDEKYLCGAVKTLEAVRECPLPWTYPGHVEMYPQDTAELYTAEIVKACASALSWVWPELSAARRRPFIDMIVERGGRPIYAGAAAGCWWANALNSNWTAVLNSGLGFAALLLREIDPVTASMWLDHARSRIVEMLDLAAEEGAGVEGPSYWLYCFGSIQDLVEAIYNVTGENLYQHPFWLRCSRFLPYIALPDLSAWVNYADSPHDGLSGSAFFHGVAARTGDGLSQWFADTVMERHDDTSWKNVIYYDPSVEARPIDTEPPCRVFSSIHLASFRSGWERDAVFMLFKGGSNAWSHTHLDLNSFVIAVGGERLAADPGPAPYSPAYWHSVEPPVSTAWHNCIVVDGAHQRMGAQYAMSYDLEEAGDCYSRLVDAVCHEDMAMVRGDASTAYGDVLSRAWRDIVYLKPDVFVVADDLLARNARVQRNFEWMLHSEYPLCEAEGAIEARGESAALLVQPVFPVGWEHKFVSDRTMPKADGRPLYGVSIRPPWHHKWNVCPGRSPYPDWDPRGAAEPLYGPECHYVVVLSVLRHGAACRYDLEPLAQSTAKGVILRAPDETAIVLFNRSGAPVDLAGIRTDAERLVLRSRGERVTWDMVRATTLSYHDRLLLETTDGERVSSAQSQKT